MKKILFAILLFMISLTVIHANDNAYINEQINASIVKTSSIDTKVYNNLDNLFSDFFEVNKIENKTLHNYELLDSILMFLVFFSPFLMLFLFFRMTLFDNKIKRIKRGYINNKTITRDNTPYFRDIPCNGDLFYANALIYLNNFNESQTNILGALILKWVKIGKIEIDKDNNTKLKLNTNIDIENDDESRLFWMIYAASNDGVLEKKELQQWIKWNNRNHKRYSFKLKKIIDDKIYYLTNEGHLFKRTKDVNCNYTNVMDDVIYKDSQELYGLKLFLEDFSNIEDKGAIEVHLWEQYLMFAFLFGIADKVAKQFNNIYPEVFESNEFVKTFCGLELDTILFD